MHKRSIPVAVMALALPFAASSAETPRAATAPIVIDVESIIEQAREAARYAQRSATEAARDAARDASRADRDVQRHLLEMQEHLKNMDLDLAKMAFVQGELGGREIVKNAPYSAEAVSESVQVLTDGNRIVKRTRTQIARDSVGRTRQEKTTAGGRTIAYVFDPIESGSFVVDPERRTVMRIPRVPSPPIPPIPPVPPVPGVAPVPPVPPVPPTPAEAGGPGAITNRVVIRRHGEVVGDDMDVRVIRIPRGEGPMHGAPTALTLPLGPRGKGETRSIGTRDFSGVKAEGTQTTHTIPAGEIGNEKSIVITSERWFSPELHIVVYAKTVDPRVGETSYRLVNLKREEPAADLFKAPADYKARR